MEFSTKPSKAMLNLGPNWDQSQELSQDQIWI